VHSRMQATLLAPHVSACISSSALRSLFILYTVANMRETALLLEVTW